MIGRCVANRPYMYLPLKGDTNDYSVNAQNPTNNGATTTTGQFGESNGAYDFSDSTDYLSWSSGIGNTIAGYSNNNATALIFIKYNTFNSYLCTFISQWGGGQNSFLTRFAQRTTYSNQIATIKNTTANSFTNTLADYNTSTDWFMQTLVFIANDLKVFKNANLFDTNTYTELAKTNATSQFRLGRQADGDNSLMGVAHTFRIYNSSLSQGQLSILNNEKGRIRA